MRGLADVKFRQLSLLASVLSSVFVVSLVAPGCSSKAQPPTGGLELVVTSDLAMPKDLDRIRVTVTHGNETLATQDQPVGAGATLMPITLAVPPTGDAVPVRAQAVGFKAGVAKVERVVVTPVPAAYVGAVELPLDYLCLDKVQTFAGNDVESSCTPGQTCVAGTCTSNVAGDLAAYSPSQVFGTGGVGEADAGAGTCFDATACFATGADASVDPTTCTVAAPVGSQSVNVALQLPTGSAGVCGPSACWIALDEGAEGWEWSGTRLRLPAALCATGALTPTVAVTAACASKLPSTPLCGAWSSLTTPGPVSSASGGAGGPGGGIAPPLIGNACPGANQQSCGNCGTQARACVNGTWSAWSSCANEGACAPNDSRTCGTGGNQSCTGSCTWGDCGSQGCVGSNSNACGNCGTQTRSCVNGAWSAYGPCTGEGECALNAVATCGTGGTKSCIGACSWSACGGQTCDATVAPTPCGNCGTTDRTCNTNTGTWVDGTTCSNQGVCAPGTSTACGAGGTETCGSNCQLGACGSQSCPASQPLTPCGNCGTKPRTCDATTGQWVDGATCEKEGLCAAGAIGTCGNGGSETCTSTCALGACTGQQCDATIAPTACSDCGTLDRTCNSNTGAWVDSSTCSGQKSCAPGGIVSCQNSGSATCSSTCVPGACTGQQCDPSIAPTACGNCGTLDRTCDGTSGTWVNSATCSGQKDCSPGSVQGCQNKGTQTCTNACVFGACTGQQCDPSIPPTACGNCVTYARSCNGATGTWVDDTSSCPTAGACSGTQSGACGTGSGTHTCNAATCTWSACTGSTPVVAATNGNVTSLASDATNIYYTYNVSTGGTSNIGDVVKVPAPQGTQSGIATLLSSTAGVFASGGEIYWLDAGSSSLQIEMSAPDGSGRAVVAQSGGVSADTGLASDGTYLYWTGGGTLVRSPLNNLTNSQAAQELTGVSANAENLVGMPGYLAWTEGSSDVVILNLSTGTKTNPTSVSGGATLFVYGLAIDAGSGMLYWGLANDGGTVGAIVGAPLAAPTTVILAAASGIYPVTVATDGTTVYWANRTSSNTNGSIMKIAASARSATAGITVAATSPVTSFLSVNANYIFWMDGATLYSLGK